jgi:hypothetical protein
VIPHALIGGIVAERVARWIYLIIYAGLGPAVSERVAVEFPKGEPAHLSTGVPLNTTAWAVMFLIVRVPVFAVVTIGLTHLVEDLGAALSGKSREEL